MANGLETKGADPALTAAAGSPPVELDYNEMVGLMCALAAGKIRQEAAARYIPEVQKLTTTAIQIGERLGALAEMEFTLENVEDWHPSPLV